MHDISPDLRHPFAPCSSAPLSTRLVKRELRNTAIQGVRPLRPDLLPMVGPAFTLRFLITDTESGRSIVGIYPPNAETLARYEEWSEANP
jgi:regulator of RNase E activity RraA